MSTTYAMKWTANAIQTVPNLSDLVSSGYPTNGDPSKGIAPTLPGAAWFHWVSQTLGCAIQGNDLTIDQTKTDQLLSAMKNLGKAIVPIGSVISFIGTTVPTGYLLCNGASVSRTDYADLFAVIGTMFGSNDSSTFKLPNLHHRFLEGTTTASEVGSYVQAGLPNITGTARIRSAVIGGVSSIVTYKDGVFSASMAASDASSSGIATTSEKAEYVIDFNAKNDNSIYNLSTVQPNSLRAFFLIRSY